MSRNTSQNLTTHQNLGPMGCNSRRQLQVPLLSAKIWELIWDCSRRRLTKKLDTQKLERAQPGQMGLHLHLCWLLKHTDGRVRIWHKDHEAMNPPRLVSTVRGWVAVVWETQDWRTSGLLIPINNLSNATAYLRTAADHEHCFMATTCHFSDS